MTCMFFPQGKFRIPKHYPILHRYHPQFICWSVVVMFSVVQYLTLPFSDRRWYVSQRLNQQIHNFFTAPDSTEEAKRAFTAQAFIGWEDALLGRFARAWEEVSHDKTWRRPVLTELMNWGRESWSNRCSHLFGIKKDQYRLSRHCLHKQVNIWYDPPFSEVLLDRNSFPTERSCILHRNNEGIARWLDQQHAFRDVVVAQTKQNTGQLCRSLAFVVLLTPVANTI